MPKPGRMHLLLAERQRVADQLSSRRTRLSDLQSRLIDCPADETSTAVEQESEVCRQLAGKLLQLEAIVLARQIRPGTPSMKRVEGRLKSDRLSVRLALLDGSK
jgi:hypothetical protein